MKKSFKDVFAFIFIFALFMALSGAVTARAGEKAQVPKLVDKSIYIYEGYEEAVIPLSNVAEDAQITCTSEDISIVKVRDLRGQSGTAGRKKSGTGGEDEIQKLFAVQPGKEGIANVNITVVQGGAAYSMALKVHVEKPGFILYGQTQYMRVGDTIEFNVMRFGFDSKIKFKSSDKKLGKLAAVDPNTGSFTAKAPGEVTITVSAVGQEESFTVQIFDYPSNGKMYVIGPDTKPCNSSYQKLSTYNDKTKHYYLIKSYLEKLNSDKGGVLVLTEGLYYVTNTLCVPSNTTIVMKDGSIIRKSKDTGCSLKATGSLFQFVAPNHTSTKFTGYNGEHDISFIGEGKAVIDLDRQESNAIAMCHGRNYTISGITFRNNNKYHFIELTGSTNVNVVGNFFEGFEYDESYMKEAINIDLPDAKSHGFNQSWTSYDCTPCNGVIIEDNIFKDLQVAIGSHQYTEGKMHENITIRNNQFINVEVYAIRLMNWKNTKITGNVFYSCANLVEDIPVIVHQGSWYSTIKNNRFEDTTKIFYSVPFRNDNDYIKNYATATVVLTEENIRDLQHNAIKNVAEDYFVIYNEEQNFETNFDTYKITGLH